MLRLERAGADAERSNASSREQSAQDLKTMGLTCDTHKHVQGWPHSTPPATLWLNAIQGACCRWLTEPP